MLEEGLVALINADAGVQALQASRLYAVILPDNAGMASLPWPITTYQNLVTESDYTTDGPSSYMVVHLQFATWASDYMVAKRTQRALLEVLDGFTGLLADADATNVSSINASPGRDDYESVARVHMVLTSVEVQYTQ